MSALYNLVIYEDLGRKSSFFLAEGGKIDLEQVFTTYEKIFKKRLDTYSKNVLYSSMKGWII